MLRSPFVTNVMCANRRSALQQTRPEATRCLVQSWQICADEPLGFQLLARWPIMSGAGPAPVAADGGWDTVADGSRAVISYRT